MGLDLDLITRHAPLLLAGLLLTVEICGIALLVGFVLGLLLALLATLRSRTLRISIFGYIAVLRGTPLLIQLFILYYGGPSFGLVLSAFSVGVLGLGLYSSAYFAEIFRAGIESIPRGQIEAAQVVGLSRLQIFLRIQLPQMMTLVLPPITNQAISLIKESAVLSVITVPEMTFLTTRTVTETFAVFEPYLMLALFYWALTSGVAQIGQRSEFALTRYLRQ
jgi:polar amino acid transport system permease protein